MEDLVRRGVKAVGYDEQRRALTYGVGLTVRKAACYGGARAEVAQLVEHSPEKAGVDSSILSLGTIPHFVWSAAFDQLAAEWYLSFSNLDSPSVERRAFLRLIEIVARRENLQQLFFSNLHFV